jgi:hypothetical protein
LYTHDCWFHVIMQRRETSNWQWWDWKEITATSGSYHFAVRCDKIRNPVQRSQVLKAVSVHMDIWAHRSQPSPQTEWYFEDVRTTSFRLPTSNCRTTFIYFHHHMEGECLYLILRLPLFCVPNSIMNFPYLILLYHSRKKIGLMVLKYTALHHERPCS